MTPKHKYGCVNKQACDVAPGAGGTATIAAAATAVGTGHVGDPTNGEGTYGDAGGWTAKMFSPGENKTRRSPSLLGMASGEPAHVRRSAAGGEAGAERDR